MTLEATKKFLEALESAGIKSYHFITDTPTNFYNNSETDFNIVDYNNGLVMNFRNSKITTTPDYASPITVQAADIADIHEARFGATLEQAKAFAEKYGIALTDSQLKILINIDSKNYNINPGKDYNPLRNFEILSDDEIAKLTEEEKAKYEATLDLYNKKYKNLPKGTAARLN